MSGIERLDAMAEAMAKLTQAEMNAEAALEAVTDGEARLASIGTDAPAMKLELARRRRDMEQRAAELRAASKELEDVMRNKISEAERTLEPLRKQVALAVEGIETLNLYLGRDEEIWVIRHGQPADIDEPITIRQMVLSMDEESLVNASLGGIDFKDIDKFQDWLIERPENLQQILPEQRGVVVLVPHRQWVDYSGDPYSDAARNAANRHSYWLLRNGERLAMMTTEMVVGERVIPLADEFTSMFEKDSFGRSIKPGSYDWAKAEERADHRKRHFMKVAMVLQGLIDRTTVWHPLRPGISVLSMESYDDGAVRVVSDAERALGDGLESFSEWHARISKEMVPGMRVVWAHNQDWRDNNYRREYSVESRKSIPDAEGLQEGVLYTLESDPSSPASMRFRFERTDKRYGYEHGDWGRWGDWEYKRKGVYVRVEPGDRFVIPIDLADIASMERFINSRQDRSQYLDMIPLLTSALEAKRAEEAQEAPFRSLLIGKLMQASGDERETVESQVDDFIQRYKLGNKWHRPLVGLTNDEQRKALLWINAEYMRHRLDARDTTKEQALVMKIRGMFPDTCVIHRRGGGDFVSLEPQPLEVKTGGGGDYWIRREWTKGGKLRKDSINLWWPVGRLSGVAIFEDEAWTERDRQADPRKVLTKPELQEIIDTLKAIPDAALISWHMGESWDEGKRKRSFRVWFTGDARDEDDDEYELDAMKNNVGYFYVKYVSVRWTREAGRIRLDYDLDRPSRAAVGHRDTLPWSENERYWDDERQAWWNRQADMTIWCDEYLRSDILRAWAEHKHRNDMQSVMSKRLWYAMHSLGEQWTARFWEREHERFMDEYGDETLWEGHRKQITAPKQAPYERRFRGDSSTPVERLLAGLINGGVQIHGFEFSEAVATAHQVGVETEIDQATLDDLSGFVIYTHDPRQAEEDDD